MSMSARPQFLDVDDAVENITCAPLRANVLRARASALFQLSAKAQDLNIDAAVIDLLVIDARRHQKLLARKDPARILEKGHQEVELA